MLQPTQRPAINGVVDVLLDVIYGEERWEVPRDRLLRLETLGQVRAPRARLLPSFFAERTN